MNTRIFKLIIGGIIFSTVNASSFAIDSISNLNTTTTKIGKMTMNTLQFTDLYMNLWKTTDNNERNKLIEQLFVEKAMQHIVPANISFQNRSEILENITMVNSNAIQKSGLHFKLSSSTINHNSILIEWIAEAPNGQVAQSGRDFMILNDDGKATVLYMFTAN
jgi:hypothetical protein